jgi:23S rRNA (uracil1939-C5)-methyltransferase
MNVRIEKLVTGGQGLGVLPDGRKVFVWNALPGELVEVEIVREKRSFAEGVAVKVIEASADRVEPKEVTYLSTSPWQVMAEGVEEHHKLSILREQFEREHLDMGTLPDRLMTDERMYQYRNKVEFGFVEEDETLRLAVTGRRSHEKVAVDGSMLARPELNRAANEVLRLLEQLHVPLGDLSHLTLRCSQDGSTVGCLTVRAQHFQDLALPPSLQGLKVIFVNGFGRKHQTKVLQTIGDPVLTDTLLGVSLRYSATSFFQVNVPLYELALEDIKKAVSSQEVVELYAGVGSIGLTVGAKNITLVDIDRFNTVYAKENLRRSSAKGEVVTSSSEKALDYIVSDKSLVVDPPRAGLSPQVISRVLEVKPSQIVYLSCDPATLARDLAKLSRAYKIQTVTAYNFFPRTPHIETLVMLERA